MKKMIGIILVCILLIISSLAIVSPSKASIVSYDTLYVGGSGPGNYTRIQDAIDDASDWDLVYVYDDSSPYYESLVINKSITLFGEDKYSTVIDSNDDECCITITDYFVSVSGFTLTNKISGFNKGLYISSICEGVKISNNIIKDTNRGIYIEGGCINFIEDNIIMDVIVGIDIRDYANNNTIYNNTIENSSYIGIEISHFSSFNWVFGNKIINGICLGIELSHSDENDIKRNTIELIEGNWIFSIQNSYNNQIWINNFMNKGFNWVFSVDSNNTWVGNYWGRPRFLARIILVYNNDLIFPYVSSVDVDWHPAKEPY